MNTQLSMLRHLVFERLNPEMDCSLTAEETVLLKKEIYSIRSKLFDAINNAILSTMDKPLLLRHMGHLQNECIFLADLLHGYAGLRPDCRELADAIAALLKVVLDYLRKYNGRYFNPENRLPESKKQLMLEELKRDGLVCMAKMKGRNILGKLPALIDGCLQGLQEKDSISYRQMAYMKMIVLELTKLLSLGKSRNWEKKLVVKLIALNFNEGAFFTYCIGLIASAVDEEKTRQKQVQLFGWYAKEIKKLASEGNCRVYDVARPGIVALIGTYIAAELEFLKAEPGQQAKDTFRDRADSYSLRLKMNMPIGAFALHIQLFIAMELFPKEVRMNTINQFMADHFCTVGTDSFSANSFDKKRTELDDASYKIVDRHLVDMRAYLKRRFEGGRIVLFPFS